MKLAIVQKEILAEMTIAVILFTIHTLFSVSKVTKTYCDYFHKKS